MLCGRAPLCPALVLVLAVARRAFLLCVLTSGSCGAAGPASVARQAGPLHAHAHAAVAVPQTAGPRSASGAMAQYYNSYPTLGPGGGEGPCGLGEFWPFGRGRSWLSSL